jgi:hypothetical protein
MVGRQRSTEVSALQRRLAAAGLFGLGLDLGKSAPCSYSGSHVLFLTMAMLSTRPAIVKQVKLRSRADCSVETDVFGQSASFRGIPRELMALLFGNRVVLAAGIGLTRGACPR